MERLTERYDDGEAFCDKFSVIEDVGVDKTILKGELIDKLAAYEDAEEKGLLLRLPCKVGDFAYYVHKEYLANANKWINTIDEVIVNSFTLNVNLFANVSLYKGGNRYSITLTPYKTLFSTKEEAEQVLKRMEGE